ncbi:hypothetical protein JD844_018770 [Phrynosoma platyrhinos]|uniref:Recombining binding protein suppressor of hairless-like protein n=1 Tax=Phrynosoma platyrhinos TaxID=52577 RepID=A0ABQ7SP50_PHRPL|nr:hypothetical protein JD844_018770 [Phrynosoma platyrhinos]
MEAPLRRGAGAGTEQVGSEDGERTKTNPKTSNQEPTDPLRDGVRRYLQFPSDLTVLILHAKVAQKSYGNEKRFFCPPPCVYLTGPGWKEKKEAIKAKDLTESSSKVCGYIGLDSMGSSHVETQKLNFEELSDSKEFSCAKTLYISDSDKRRHFQLVLRLFFSNGQEIGTFHSKLIKVISKPSQKKQSLKNTDLCISSGSKVSLFNRLRSQTVSTRYLSVEGGTFTASARQWAAFTLYLADDYCSQSQNEFPLREGYIRYGSIVRLICTATGIALPPLAAPCPKETNRELLNDSSCWTIIGTETVEYTFSDGLTGILDPGVEWCYNLMMRYSLILYPVIGSASHRSPKSLMCVVPDVSAFSHDWRWLRYPITVPLLLLRNDGLIYSSTFSFTYTPEQSFLTEPPILPDMTHDSDTLLDTIHQEFTRANFHLFMQS